MLKGCKENDTLYLFIYCSAIKGRKANCIGNIYLRNCLLNHIIYGKIGGIEGKTWKKS